MICVAKVTIIGGSSVNLVRMKPLTMPHTAPTPRDARITTGKGAPVLHTRQAVVAQRQVIEPTEMSISPSTRMKAIGSIRNTSAR